MGDPKERIRAKALEVGFDAVGFARAELSAEARAHLAEFLARGHHGDMGWLARNTDRRGDPRTLWPEAATVIVLGMNYGPDHDPLEDLAHRDTGTVSVYARGRDYHDVVKKRLKQLGRWLIDEFGGEIKVFVDTAPVMEKPLGQAAGVGWQGKHTNLVSRSFGSWLFLGEVFTTLELAPGAPEGDFCGSCHRCLEACPTDAFPAPYQLDATRCISYLTIEHPGHIPWELRPALGNRIYGCDDCLAVCPWNKFASRARNEWLQARESLKRPALAELARLDDTAFRERFSGSPVKRLGRDRFVRNVLIALGNSGEPGLAAVAAGLLADGSALVRAMAVWALGELDPARLAAEAARHRPGEADPDVRAEWEAALAGRDGPAPGSPPKDS
ncbi:MAG: tRNA epoxyqueuosine(34) reductase QueG [Thiohalorhabdus sp.]|uniref:tRNA epoxyqueuosine(34) reductase QueG n=1 Tax=Thiohalorhabdus sp. TaxID=3094134 RepID=UPI003980A59B